jgi:hypothetical protein
MSSVRLRRPVAGALILIALGAAGCGGDDKQADKPATTAASADGADLAAIKTYLLGQTAQLKSDTAAISETAQQYDALAARYGYDYAKLLKAERQQVRELVGELQRQFRKANPSYELMEGVVAGVPSLADYDGIIDAGSDGSDPENAVPFSIETKDGRTFKQPGNFFYLLETSAFGTDEQFAAKGVTPDLDGDGKVAFGEALPDAQFLAAMTKDFDTTAAELDASAKTWEPTLGDALTALVVMTPTMSEYFNAWKNSRFVAGADATEKGFAGTSRLQDIADILDGLVLVYGNVQPAVAKADAQQAAQTGEALGDLAAFASRLEQEESGGKRFTAQDADALGTEAQRRAEAIAGQVSQAAGKLDVELEN